MKNFLFPILLSILPVSELRGGIPYGLSNVQLTLPNILLVSGICILANAFVVLPIFLFLDFFHVHLIKFKAYNALFNNLIKRIQKKSHKLEPQINKYGYVALSLFVALPLPITGAWTGAIIAWLLDLNRKKSFVAIFSGVVIAGIIITLASIGFLSYF